MRFLFLLSWIFSLPLIPHLSAQDSPWKGRTFGLYFSRKQFTFDESYNTPVFQFLISCRGKETLVEDLKSETLVALGQMLMPSLREALQLDSIWFINESPEAARSFISTWQPGKLSPAEHPDIGATDRILVLSGLTLGSYKATSVFVRSNRIITEPVIYRNAKLNFEVWDPRTAALEKVVEVCLDQKDFGYVKRSVDFHSATSATGAQLSSVFSAGIAALLGENQWNCPTGN